VALCLSGGGAQGAAQAGAAAELLAAGLRPDLVVGTSVGAWNGSWIAAHPDAEGGQELLRHWEHPEVARLFRGLIRGYLGALTRGRLAALGDLRIRRLVERTCGGRRFEDIEVPLAIAVVDYLDSGPLDEAVLAASAIPTLLPPVRQGDRLLVDAGFVDNFGVAEAVRRGARSVVLVDASVGALRGAPGNVPAMLDRANLVTRIHQRRHAEAGAAEAGVRLEVLAVAERGFVLDFAGAAEQIAIGRAVADRWLRGAAAPPAGVAARAGVPSGGAERPRLATAPA
jgi:NTE family protein